MPRWILIILWGVFILTIVDGGYLVYFSSYSLQEFTTAYDDSQHYQRSLDGPVISFLIEFLDAIERFIERHEKFFIVFSTMAIAAFTATLWRATSGLFRMAERQAEDMKSSLAIAKESTEAAQKSADLAHAEFLATHRPKLIIRRVQLRRDKGASGIEFVLANIGESLARKIAGNINVRFVPIGDEKTFQQQSRPLYGADVTDISAMLQGKEHGPFLEAGEAQPIFWLSKKVTDEPVDKVRDREQLLFFFGRITYWNVSETTVRDMGFFRRYDWSYDKFIEKKDDPDYEWN